MTGEGETSVSTPYAIAKYRLELVCEAPAPYDAEHLCDRPDRAAAFVRTLIGRFAQEVMGSLFLDVRNRAIGHTIPYMGTVSRLKAEPRGLLIPALMANASGIIMFHNHPSGDPSPSSGDLALTEDVAEAAAFLGLCLLEHIIIGEGDCFASMSRRPDWPMVARTRRTVP